MSPPAPPAPEDDELPPAAEHPTEDLAEDVTTATAETLVRGARAL